MEEIQELRQRLSEQRPVEWESFPDIGLYMDQIISYMPRQLIHYGEGDLLTSAMVNNYIKDGLLPRAEGKRYSRIHLAYLTAICVLKQVLSVKEAKRLIATGTKRKRDTAELYAYFCRQLSDALTETAQSLPEDCEKEDLPRLALNLALRSYADRLACQRILDILAEQDPGEKQPRKREKNN
ncbi:hypothetical protein B5G43_11880 [Flavonifractor sp. An92]|uniref:DUF1836 domain-containing protein n=1 Tax=Flavonifractor sp. An92 TaxID=1965666 RepID=UPI000B3707B6|nr:MULTISPECIES: DUF1836 domain-containing protein [unclassified Flavonifractor]OUN05710.1 hypothetical protein B5G43_11880 [Flavonifractor sp. An92]OUQ19690.1 hypothetical protein B5E80_17325 [Flavonifractor sp. An135]